MLCAFVVLLGPPIAFAQDQGQANPSGGGISADNAQAPAKPAGAAAPDNAQGPANTSERATAEGAKAAPEQSEAGGAEPTPLSGTATLLPRDLSPWGMFLNADILVKFVMLGLAFASLVTWTVALAKGLELFTAKRRLRTAISVLAAAPSLAEASRHLDERQRGSALVRAAMLELRLSADTSDKEGVKERVASRLERIEAAVGRSMIRGTGFLATIGATAPFVGLFGTVWGIMNSFIGISRSHTTNLAVVAPGIAEALLATALGLAAAVPAVVIYNMFSRAIASYRALFGDGAAEVLRLVSRDLDRQERDEAGETPREPIVKGRRPASPASLPAAE
jgi:biopolymer transport protein ExbB